MIFFNINAQFINPNTLFIIAKWHYVHFGRKITYKEPFSKRFSSVKLKADRKFQPQAY